jgi:16S rRNA (adenine1518-N6/adenine1519-N6)-dimethyltransferase
VVRRRASARPPALKRFGQHFLTDRRILVAIADALQLTGSETVVEIGSGRAELTELIRPRAGRLIAIEIDRALAANLRGRYANVPNVTVVEGDVLAMDLPALAGGPFVLAGNVPYYITTPILFQALRPPRPERALFLVQREVADRVTAKPSTSAYGALSVNVQVVAKPELLFTVPASAFRPPPKVESALIRLTPLAKPLIADSEAREFQKFVQAIFAMRRKQLQRLLRSLVRMPPTEIVALLERHGWSPAARPETLSPAEFARLFASVRRFGLGPK